MSRKPRVSRVQPLSRTRVIARLETRELLLAASNELLIEKDGKDFSLAEVAKRTSLSAALVQYYFGSKDGLLMALIERGIRHGLLQLVELEKLDVPATVKLRRHIRGLVAAHVKAPYVNELLNMMMQHRDRERARQVAEMFIRPIANFHRSLLSQGKREGSFRDVDPVHFYFLLLGTCNHIVVRRSLLREIFNIDCLNDEYRRSFSETIYRIVIEGIST